MNKDDKERAFETLVRQHKSTVYSVCYMFAAGKEDADDLFQEVLINLWKGIDKFREKSSARTWIYRVSMNTCVSSGRKKRVNTERLEREGEISAYDSIEQNPQNRMLHDRIRKLEPFDRAIVLLWLEDMTYEEIGAIVGVSAKLVGVRLVRIREKLKKL